MLLNPDSPEAAIEAKVVHAFASDLGLEAIVLEARNENDVDAAFQTLGQRPASAVIIVPDPWARTRRFQLAELAGQRKLPDHLSATGFCRIGRSNQLWPKSNRPYPAIWSLHRPYYKGEKPGDLPVMQPTKFELIINLKVAKALGLEIPPPQLLASADEVIDEPARVHRRARRRGGYPLAPEGFCTENR